LLLRTSDRHEARARRCSRARPGAPRCSLPGRRRLSRKVSLSIEHALRTPPPDKPGLGLPGKQVRTVHSQCHPAACGCSTRAQSSARPPQAPTAALQDLVTSEAAAATAALRLSSASPPPSPPTTRGRATVSGRVRVLSLAVSYPYVYTYLRSLNNAF
jgi:hypothetical protein